MHLLTIQKYSFLFIDICPMEKESVLIELQNAIRRKFEYQETAHDYWHVVRVVKMAKHLAKLEGGNVFIIEVAAWCHDVGDYKFEQQDSAEVQITQLLNKLAFPPAEINTIISIVEAVSFSGAKATRDEMSVETKIVQDADRLDAIGAIGIARCFAYAGHKGHGIFHPEKRTVNQKSCEAIAPTEGTAIAHFYDKLLLLKDLLNTESAQAIGVKRHTFMEQYLNQFYKELDCVI